MSLKRTSCSIPSLKTLIETHTQDDLHSMTTLSFASTSISVFPEVYIWTLFPHLQSLNLSCCALTNLPAAALTKSLPELVKLDLSCNLFQSLKHFVPFGKLRLLEELDVRKNPIPHLELKVYVLRELLFPPETTRVKLVKYLMGGYLRPSLQPSSKVKNPKRTITLHQFLLQCQRLPASIPRPGAFPMLSLLNAQQIMEDEVQSAKPYRDEDLVKEKESRRNRSVTGKMRGRVSVHPCVERKERVKSVPRLFKIPDYMGAATLQPESNFPPSPLIDRKDLNHFHNISHQELDFRQPKPRKLFFIRLKKNLDRDNTEVPGSYSPSVAAEEDTRRQ